jgi:hypothetical protein
MSVPHLVSLRSEPSSCNAHGSVGKLLRQMKASADDVRIVGATHCDPEDPTDAFCRLFCGGTSAESRASYQRFVTLYLQDVLGVPQVDETTEGWAEAVRRGVESGSLAVEPIVPAR